jgi:poly-beta-1,6-N-acetyl-D-glucosamine synthase
MSLDDLAVAMLFFIALYPPVTAAFWIAGGLVFRLREERSDIESAPPGGWPPLTVLVPAYNEQQVIAGCVRSVLEVEYPDLEVLVLDDGSTDSTADAAEEACAGDSRAQVVRDEVNRGKAERLNIGFRRTSTELVIVCDADTHLHPLAPKLLVARMLRSRRTAAVAGSPHVTNRVNLLCAMQVLEAASIIGLIRRTQALRGRVGTVAGVLALFRRDAVLGVDGYRGDMATEDIDLTWRLLLAGWSTAFEPEALIGMQVPSKLSSLWAQRCRWARGQGEVLHENLGTVRRWAGRGMWPIALESIASLVWVIAWALAIVIAVVDLFVPSWDTLFGLAIAWGVAIAVVCTIQVAFALTIGARYDRRALRAFLLGPLYPLFFWAIASFAALRAEVPALVRGPAERRVVWDIARDPTEDSREADDVKVER